MGFERISNTSGSLCKETRKCCTRTSYICTIRDQKDKYFIFVEAYVRLFYYGVRNVYARNEGKLLDQHVFVWFTYRITFR